MDFVSRIHRACKAGTGVELVLRAEDIRWLTGFSGSTSSAILNRTEKNVYLLVDDRYLERAESETRSARASLEVVQIPQGVSVAEVIAEVVGDNEACVDPEHLTVARSQALGEKVKLEFSRSHFNELRRVKDADEIALISQCAHIADTAISELLEDGIVGKTEKQVAARLDQLMRSHGADDVGFDTIIATGPHGARPHHEPSDEIIKSGHMVIMDFGAELDGYRSDMTRTVRVGTTSQELEDMFEIVREAQAAGVSAVAAGVMGSAVDAAVREVFAREGVEHEYVHGTGHGIGLYIHEEPILSPRCTAVLQESEVVTVEPGLYRKGVGGVRIEDLVVVTGTGCRLLSHTPKDLSCPRSPQTI